MEDWRFFSFLPKLVSKLIQTPGDFAMKVFHQTGRLIIDFVFLCLFLVLMVLRPIQSWIHLLEDDEHKKMRLLRHYIQWVPDIIQKRHQMRREMEEVFSSSLKEQRKVREVQIHLSVVNASYLKDLIWIRDQIREHPLEEEYGHLIHMAQWWEGKRAHKMSRLYACELNFLKHPNQSLHNANLQKYKNEMLVFESEVNKQYEAVESYTVAKVPLWSKACGLKTRTRKETQQVLIKCLPYGMFSLSMMILLNLLFLYRGPTLIKKLWRRWHDRRNIVLYSTKEYLLDLLTVFRILLVIALIYRAPFLIADITQDILLKRSWKAVRETAKRYPTYIQKDLFAVFSTLLSLKTIGCAFRAFLFGIFMPIVLCLTLHMPGYLTYWTGRLYMLLIGFPFLLSYGLAQLDGSLISMAIGVFVIVLLVAVVAMVKVVSGMMNKLENPFQVKSEPYTAYFHFTWKYGHVFQIVELLQQLAVLAVIISDLPIKGSSTLKTLLSFSSIEVKIVILIVLWILPVFSFCFYFFICGRGENTFFRSFAYLEYLHDFSSSICTTFFVGMVGLFLTIDSCKRTDMNNHQTWNMNSSSLKFFAVSAMPYVEPSSLKCLEEDYRAIVTVVLVGLLWYSVIAIVSGFGIINDLETDSFFSGHLFKFCKVLVLILLLFASIAMFTIFIIVLVIMSIIGLEMMSYRPANSFVLELWHRASFFCGAVAAVAALVAQIQNKQDNPVPLIMFLGGCGGVLFFAAVISIIHSRRLTQTDKAIQTFGNNLVRSVEQLVQGGHMVKNWTKVRSQWYYDKINLILTERKPYKYIRFNWTNMHVIVFQIVELLQLLAMVFVISDLPMLGASTLNIASNHLILNFASFEFKMWTTLFLFAAWVIGYCYAFCINDTENTCGWRLFLALFGNTLFVTFVGNFLTFVSCRYTDCPPNADNQTLNMNSSDLNSCTSSVLYGYSNWKCWEGNHRPIATAGLLGLVWYTTTAILSGPDVNNPHQDLKFCPIYNTVINFFKAFMIGVVILATSSPKIVFCFLIFANIAAFLFTVVVYNRIFHHPPTSSFVLKLWRQVSFICGAVAAVAGLIALIQNKQDNLIPLVIFIGGCGCVLAFAVVISSIFCDLKLTLVPKEKLTQEVWVRLHVCRLEKQLVQDAYMVNSWSKLRSQWNRLVKGVRLAKEDSHSDMYRRVPDRSPKNTEQRSQKTSIPAETDAEPPPPPYKELFPNILVPYGTIPPPPAYPGAVFSPEDVDIKGFGGGDTDDDDDPDVQKSSPDFRSYKNRKEYQLNPQSMQFYDDSIRLLEEGLSASEHPLVSNFERELERSRCHDPLLALESNEMRNLLLLLEQHIHYSAFSFAFISHIRLWRAAVNACSNWTGLLCCLDSLEDNLNGNFCKATPSMIVIPNRPFAGVFEKLLKKLASEQYQKE